MHIFTHKSTKKKQKKKTCSNTHKRSDWLTLTKTHLHSSCHQQISGNQRCTSIHKSPGCSHRSGHTDGQGSANTRLYLRGGRTIIIIIIPWKRALHACWHPYVQVHVLKTECAFLASCTKVCMCATHLSADSLNTWVECIIMRITTQWNSCWEWSSSSSDL